MGRYSNPDLRREIAALHQATRGCRLGAAPEAALRAPAKGRFLVRLTGCCSTERPIAPGAGP
jgi:hypothetical protein